MDNSATYWIMTNGSSRSPELHKLIQLIRLRELELRIQLVVIHVPGLVMILQRTDGLSRGIWFSPLHHGLSQQDITASVFAPMEYDSLVVNQVVQTFDLPTQWRYQPWDGPWNSQDIMSQFTVWFPPPEITRQLLIFILEAWVEQPLTTWCLIVIP